MVATVSSARSSSKKTILGAGITWTVAYILMLIGAYRMKQAFWPVVYGGWCLSWEILFSSQSYMNWKTSRSWKHLASAIVFLSWAMCDSVGMMQLVEYGNGSEYCELGIFKLSTREERKFAIASCVVISFILSYIWSLFSLRWYKYQSFVGLHMLFFAQMRLPVVKEAWNALGNGYLPREYMEVYAYFFISFLSHVLFCIDKWNGDLVQPAWLAKFYMLQLPLGNMLTLLFASEIMGMKQNTLNILSISIFVAAILFGPLIVRAQVYFSGEVAPVDSKGYASPIKVE